MRRTTAGRAVGSPLRILLLLSSFALAGYAGVRLLDGRGTEVALWFAGAALLHDLVLLPLYAGADRLLARGLTSVDRRAWTPYVRVPAVFSGLLLLVWFPMVSGDTADRYRASTTLSGDGFLARWLLITAVLFGCSAVLLAARLRRATKRRPPAAH